MKLSLRMKSVSYKTWILLKWLMFWILFIVLICIWHYVSEAGLCILPQVKGLPCWTQFIYLLLISAPETNPHTGTAFQIKIRMMGNVQKNWSFYWLKYDPHETLHLIYFTVRFNVFAWLSECSWFLFLGQKILSSFIALQLPTTSLTSQFLQHLVNPFSLLVPIFYHTLVSKL
jgi:hypothetical protein